MGVNAPTDLSKATNKEYSTSINSVRGDTRQVGPQETSSTYTNASSDFNNNAPSVSTSTVQAISINVSPSWPQQDNRSAQDSFNDSVWSTISDTDHMEVISQISQAESSLDSTKDYSIIISGSLLNTSQTTELQGSGNYSLRNIERASEGAVLPQLQHNNSSDEHTEGNNEVPNMLHQQWGFTPLTFFTATVDCGSQSINHSNMEQWVKLAHATANKHNAPNYLGARVRVVSQLNLRQWRHLLKDYKFSRVCDYVEFGFPLTLNYKEFTYNTEVSNHPSATHFPRAVEDYLQTDISYNAIVGPFDAPPIERLHVSPMMSRPKPDGTRRIIIDMSWPHGNSVNSHIPDNVFDDMEFQLRYPTVDNVVARIAAIGPEACLYKIDLKRAYRNLRTDPRDFTVLGLYWQGRRYVDVSIPFGIKTGASACQMVTDCITHLMASQTHWTCAYLDDVIGVATPASASNAFTSLNNLIRTLGLPINQEKVVAPAQEMTCLGININAQSGTLTIPPDKVHNIKRLCNQWASKAYATRRSIQRLLGHLLYLHRCVHPSRLFVNRILQVLRMAPPQGRISLDAEFFRDINWFRRFLDKFNGVTKIHNTAAPARDLYVDASLQGIGAYFEGQPKFQNASS